MSTFIRWISPICMVVLLAVVGAGCTAGLKASYHKKRADQYYTDGKYDQSEIEYKNVLRHDPKNAEALAHLGFIYFDEGRIPEALKILTSAAQLTTNNLPVRLKLGHLYLNLSKFKEAREEASYVLGKNPTDEQAPILLAEAAITTNEINEVRQRLQTLVQGGKTAPLMVALGTLAFRERDLKTAEASFEAAVRLDPKFAEACSALGNVYIAQKDWKQAEAAFKQAMDLAPLRSGKALFYANFEILTGDPETGKIVLQDLVKQAPDYLPAWLALAQLAAAQKDYAGGITLLGNVLSRNPGDAQALLLKANLERQQGQTAQATKDLEAMVRKFPESSTVFFQLAVVQTDVNDYDKAIGNLNQAIRLNPNYAEAILLLATIQLYQGNSEPAVASLQQLILQQPQFLPARLMLAQAYRIGGRLDGAVQIYRELERAFPDNPRMPLLLGITLLEQKKNTEARAAFDKSLKLQSDYPPALEQLVGLDIMEKQYAVATQRVQQQINQSPKAAPLQYLLARIQFASGDTNQAQTILQEIIGSTPDYIPAYVMLAEIYASVNENQKALADLMVALTKDPKNTRVLLLMALTYNAEKDYDSARDYYEKLLVATPDNVVALNNLAYLYSENLGQINKGEQLARRARELSPDPSTADTLGWILSQKGQYPSAASLLRESATKLDADPEVQEVLYHLGMTYYLMGDEANARTTFRRALQLGHDFPETNECHECLAILEIDPKTSDADSQALLEKRVSIRPKDIVAYMRLATIYEREGMTDKAIAADEAILQVTPQNVPTLMNLAKIYAPKDPQKALNFAKDAYKVSPNDPMVTHTLGRIAFVTGDYSWSVNLLQLTARDLPQDPQVLYDLGQAFYSVGRVADARVSMQNALQSDPSFPQADAARRFLAMTDLADKPVPALAAQSQVANILKSEPDYVPALMAKALIAEQKPDLSIAQQTYEAVLSLYPDFAPAQKQLIKIYAKDPKNDAKSYPLAVKVRQVFPNDPEVAKAFGIILYRQNDFTRAVSLLEESALQLNRDAELMYYLGMAQYQLKHYAQSKTALQQALNFNLPSPHADDAKKILAELK